MAQNNYQQVPFWDFIRSFESTGAGVDHPAEGFPFSSAHPQASGAGFFGSAYPQGAGFPFGTSSPFGPAGFYGPHGGHGHGPHGRSGHGHGRCDRETRRGRHNRHPDGADEKSPHGSRTASPNPENPENPEAPGDEARQGPHHGGWRGRRSWGGRGGHGGWGGRGGHRGPPPFAVPGGFDLNALIGSLSEHPLAQAFKAYAEQAGLGGDAKRSGETLVPEDTDSESTFVPPIDIFSTEKEYVLHISLPGAKKEDVGVNWDAEKGILNLAGVVYRQGDEEFLKLLSKSERKVGVFERTVKLPPGAEEKEEVDGDNITAKLEDGVLVVVVPKVEKDWTEVKRVDIE